MGVLIKRGEAFIYRAEFSSKKFGLTYLTKGDERL